MLAVLYCYILLLHVPTSSPANLNVDDPIDRKIPVLPEPLYLSQIYHLPLFTTYTIETSNGELMSQKQTRHTDDLDSPLSITKKMKPSKVEEWLQERTEPAEIQHQIPGY